MYEDISRTKRYTRAAATISFLQYKRISMSTGYPKAERSEKMNKPSAASRQLFFGPPSARAPLAPLQLFDRSLHDSVSWHDLAASYAPGELTLLRCDSELAILATIQYIRKLHLMHFLSILDNYCLTCQLVCKQDDHWSLRCGSTQSLKGLR